MNELELLEQVVDELDSAEQEERKDMEEFRSRYDLLVDCAIDELNDEILKNKLSDTSKTGIRFMLLKHGPQVIYKRNIISTAVFTGGEEFKLKRVERGSGKTGMVNYVFEPLYVADFNYLVMPYSEAMKHMDKPFSAMIVKYLLPAMESIEKDVLKLQREFEERHRDREIKLAGGDLEAYKESAWN